MQRNMRKKNHAIITNTQVILKVSKRLVINHREFFDINSSKLAVCGWSFCGGSTDIVRLYMLLVPDKQSKGQLSVNDYNNYSIDIVNGLLWKSA